MGISKRLQRATQRIGYGLLAGLAAVTFFGGGLFVAWRVMSAETLGFVQQSIGDTAALLASHAASDFEPVVAEIRVAGEAQRKGFLAHKESEEAPLVAAVKGAEKAAEDGAAEDEGDGEKSAEKGDGAPRARMPAIPFVDLEPEILDLALWVRPSQESPPNRVHLALNPKFTAQGEAPQSQALALASKVQDSEDEDREIVAQAFAGKPVIAGVRHVDPSGMILIAVPVTQSGGATFDVVVAHVAVSRFQRAFRQLQAAPFVRGSLIDGKGTVLASAVLDKVFTEVKDHPLAQAYQASTLRSGQIDYIESDGRSFLGGYYRVGLGGLWVLVSVPEADAMAGLTQFKVEATWTLVGIFAIGLLLGIRAGGRVGRAQSSGGASFDGSGSSSGAGISRGTPTGNTLGTAGGETLSQGGTSPDMQGDAQGAAASAAGPGSDSRAGELRVMTVLHGSLRGIPQIIESQLASRSPNSPEGIIASDAQGLVDLINDYLTLVSTRVRDCGGVFERYAGTSFTATFGLPGGEGDESWRAIRCALLLRFDFAALNESRKVDGFKPLSFGMGIHAGRGLAGRIGAAGAIGYAAIGPAHACARALDHLSAAEGVDLLVSADAWSPVEKRFVGEALGESRLTEDTGLVQFFAIWGYRDEAGQEIRVETPYCRSVRATGVASDGGTAIQLPAAARVKRWYVNNGSQIVGPLKAEEIAAQLLSQDMDFDCECWLEGRGETAPIRKAEIFGGPETDEAVHWVHDGKTIHGPLTLGFIATALQRGAMPPDALVCDTSTVAGWRPLRQWLAEHKGQGNIPPPPPDDGPTADVAVEPAKSDSSGNPGGAKPGSEAA